jgi:Flp pilus assembly protein TadD
LTRANEPNEKRQLHYLLSSIFSAQGASPEAEQHLREVLAIDPDDATANNDLGYLWAEQGKNLEEAERLIRKAIETDRAERKRQGALEIPAAEEDNAAYIDSLGWVLFKQGHVQEACQQLERATQLADGDDPVIWDHLGHAYRQLDQLPQARQAWQKALRLYQTNKRTGMDDRRHDLEAQVKALEREASGRRDGLTRSRSDPTPPR